MDITDSKKMVVLLQGVDCLYSSVEAGAPVNKIICDSRYVEKGDLFVAIRGESKDGHDFIQEALKKGASYFVVDNDYIDKTGLKKIVVNDTRSALAKLVNNYYDYPSNKIKVVGITGTNGKTTTSYILERIVEKGGRSAGVIGTINYRFKDKVLDSKNTTPGCLAFQGLLREMVRSKLDYAICEISSHALDQRRTEGIEFRYAIYTNLTPEHLDYHKTMERYLQAKMMLFEKLSGQACAILNMDDPYSDRIAKATKAKVLTYGLNKKADIWASAIESSYSGNNFSVTTPSGKIEIRSKLIGRHNVYNILAALSVGIAEGIDPSAIKHGIEAVRTVPGRLESVDMNQQFKVFIDYAHTEDALFNVLTTLRSVAKNRIVLVFGCGGDRDKTKRPKMGRVASDFADYFIVTSDNPRSEDPYDIFKDIESGIEKDRKECEVILSRYDAIKKALQIAGPQDIVLIAGKGHEDYQIFKDKTVHFSDKETVVELLGELNQLKVVRHV